MTEQEFLERVLLGQIHVDADTLEVHLYHRKNKRWHLKQPDRHPDNGRYRFRFGATRQTFYRNKVVWLYFKRTIPPEGFVIDHSDLNRFNDHPSNLALMSAKESHQQGNEIQYDQYEENWKDFFDWIEFTGSLPPEDSILWE